MSDLTTDSVISYGDVEFGVKSKITGLDMTPVYDSAGRVVIYTVYRLTIHGYVEAGQDLDEPFLKVATNQLRRKLVQPGDTLVVRDSGFGDFEIQTNRQDVKWGPKPQLISWANTGHRLVWEVTWKVEVAIGGECHTGTRTITAGGGPMEFCYTVGWSIDADRYTRRTYSGHVRVPAVRKSVGQTLLPDHADRMRAAICPTVPDGFRRTDSYDLSEDKCELRFTVTDEEMPPNALPANCTDANASHSISAVPGLVMWSNTLSASYKPMKGVSPADMGLHFARLARDRVYAATRKGLAHKGQKIRPVFVALKYDDADIYAREKALFSVSWKLVIDIQDVLQGTNLWYPVPNNSWDAWNRSMDFRNDSRGNARMQFRAEEDALVSLCLTKGTQVGKPGRRIDRSADAEARPNPPERIVRILSDAFSEERPDPANSWLSYDLSLRVEVTDNVAVLPLLPDTPVPEPIGSRTLNATDGFSLGHTPPAYATFLTQRRGYPKVELVLSGSAIRAGYDITPPSLLRVGGVEPVRTMKPDRGDHIQTRTLPTPFQALVGASWQIRYTLPGVPRTAFTSPNGPLNRTIESGGGSLGGFFVSQ